MFEVEDGIRDSFVRVEDCFVGVRDSIIGVGKEILQNELVIF
ncbi:MAG TPA: hypothetical protein VIL99_10555 [Ignavibacteria bacterium]